MPLSKEIPMPVSDPAPGRKKVSGIIFDIQRWSRNDGQGIRTVIFFKGCPLHCIWCCNPESQSFQPELSIFPNKCRNCGACEDICPEKNALKSSLGGLRNRSACKACGLCVTSCIWEARKMMGKRYTIPQLMEVIKRDMVFYRRSGGGVTFSGGEATWQPEFLSDVATKCSELGIDLALETCGYFEWETVKNTLKMLNLIFLDIKHMDPLVHKEHTGKDNRLILENAINISQEKIPLVVRIPVIPGINDSNENIMATAEFVKKNLSSCLGIELLPYHALGRDKYRSLGRNYRLEDTKPPSEGELRRLKDIITGTGVKILVF